MARKVKKQVLETNASTGGVRDKKVRDSTQVPTMNQNPCWQIGYLQLDGSFGWNAVHRRKLLEVYSKLSNLETMTWGEIQQNRKGFHSVDISSLAKVAQRELERLKLNDISELYSIRLSGAERVWGVRVGSIVRLLWWDPEHQVCPSQLKHT